MTFHSEGTSSDNDLEKSFNFSKSSREQSNWLLDNWYAYLHKPNNDIYKPFNSNNRHKPNFKQSSFQTFWSTITMDIPNYLAIIISQTFPNVSSPYP